MHEMLEAYIPGAEVMARSGDVDDLVNQVRLPGPSPCSHFYTGRGGRRPCGADMVCMHTLDTLQGGSGYTGFIHQSVHFKDLE